MTARTGVRYANFFLQGDDALKTFQALGTPPYRFSVLIPRDIVAGLYQLWATGCRRPGDCDNFDPITINVEPVWPESADGSQVASGTPGVTINTGGVPLIAQSTVAYPTEAVEKSIGGNVVLQVTPNWDGRVERVQVLSGPEELRKAAIKGVLTWRFPSKAGQKPRQVEINFDPVEAYRGQALQSPAQTVPKARAAMPAPTPPSTPRRIRVSEAEQAAKLISKVEAVYPPLAKQVHIQGVVRFDAIIGNDRRVETIQLVTGHPLLVEAAREAVKQWTYSPTLVNGSPVEVVTKIEVEFFLLN